ncbi:MAG: dTMP kinase [Eggerthellaceae bacterium]|nr:dTMP kinase [Eggerthellaceae bacterium]
MRPEAPQGAGAAPRGVLITFEGGDGAGKSTHIRFLARALEDAGREVVRLREPGGTAVGEALRALVLDPANEGLSDRAELLIYEAARAQITDEVIRPALERGAVVLCDRFYDSTVAYQAAGRGLPRAFVDAANAFAADGIVPDRTLVLSAGDAATSLRRAVGAGEADRLEQAGAPFHERVAEAFRQLAADEPGRVRAVDSSGARSVTAAQVFHELADLFPWMGDAGACDEAYFSVLDDREGLAAWLDAPAGAHPLAVAGGPGGAGGGSARA